MIIVLLVILVLFLLYARSREEEIQHLQAANRQLDGMVGVVMKRLAEAHEKIGNFLTDEKVEPDEQTTSSLQLQQELREGLGVTLKK